MDGFNRKSDVKDTLGRPNRDIRGFLAKLETSRTRKQLELKVSEYVDRIPPTVFGSYQRKVSRRETRHPSTNPPTDISTATPPAARTQATTLPKIGVRQEREGRAGDLTQACILIFGYTCECDFREQYA